VISPTTAKGQRSRSHRAANTASVPGASANTYRSCDSLHQISMGDKSDSALGMRRKSMRPPRWLWAIASGSAFDKPPAPTS
jgi:hypothetical protein